MATDRLAQHIDNGFEFFSFAVGDEIDADSDGPDYQKGAASLLPPTTLGDFSSKLLDRIGAGGELAVRLAKERLQPGGPSLGQNYPPESWRSVLNYARSLRFKAYFLDVCVDGLEDRLKVSSVKRVDSFFSLSDFTPNQNMDRPSTQLNTLVRDSGFFAARLAFLRLLSPRGVALDSLLTGKVRPELKKSEKLDQYGHLWVRSRTAIENVQLLAQYPAGVIVQRPNLYLYISSPSAA